MMKRALSLALSLMLLLPSTVFGADKGIAVYIDGTQLNFTSKPVVDNGTTLVPLRTIFEGLGADVSWNQATQTVSAQKEDVNIQIVLGQSYALRNNQTVALSTKARNISGVTYVPLRFIGESFGNTIEVKGKDINIVSPSIPSFELKSEPSQSQQTGKDLTIQEVGKLSNRVVYVEVLDSSNKVISTGSGVVVSAEGEIVTNYHVIEGAAAIRVEFDDQRSFNTTTLLQKDPKTDLALIKIPATKLDYVKIGDSAGLELGESVIAIGSPLGYKNTLSTGIVSQPLRTVEGKDYVQISAPIDHGSSGGALFNMRGELVGITSAFVQSTAEINLAVPSNNVTAFLAKPKTAQSLAAPQTVASNTAAAAPTDVKSLASYLNSNFTALTFKDLVLDVKWNVTMDDDGQTFNIAGLVKNSTQWADLSGYQTAEDTVIPSMILYLSDKLHDNLKLSNTSINLYLNLYSKEYPDAYPARAITREGAGYRLNYNFAYGAMDYASGYLEYSLDPGDVNAIQSLKVK